MVGWRLYKIAQFSVFRDVAGTHRRTGKLPAPAPAPFLGDGIDRTALEPAQSIGMREMFSNCVNSNSKRVHYAVREL
jgi:hypothetical protein